MLFRSGFYYRSDHFSLAKRGVPMLYFDAGDDLIAGGKAAGKAAAEDYEANRYHGPKDEYDPLWNWSGVVQDVGIYYAVGRALAEGIIAEARARGYRRLRLDTIGGKMQAAIKLYQSMGFVEIAPYYASPVPDTAYMELAL